MVSASFSIFLCCSSVITWCILLVSTWFAIENPPICHVSRSPRGVSQLLLPVLTKENSTTSRILFSANDASNSFSQLNSISPHKDNARFLTFCTAVFSNRKNRSCTHPALWPAIIPLFAKRTIGRDSAQYCILVLSYDTTFVYTDTFPFPPLSKPIN